MTANQDADIFQEAESAKGILRLYKDTNEITTGELRYPSDPDETNLETDDKTKDSKSDPHPESQQQQQSGKTRPQIISPDWETTVCVLAVPSYMSPGDFLNFVGPVRSEVSHFRIIRDSVPNRFMVLMKFRSRETTSEFYKRYNGRTFSSLEPEICHVVYLKSIEIRAGCIPPYAFPFLNDDPFLQNNPHSTSSPAASVTLNRTTVISDSNPGANPLSLDEPSDSQHDHPATVVSPTTNADNQSSMIELPTCPVCLERMDSSVTGLLTILCQHTFHCHCLTKWGEGSCPVCRYSQKSFRSTATPMPPGVTASIALHQRRIAATAARTSTQERGNVEEDVAAGLTATTDGVTEDRNECAECGSTDNLWICLICGNIGCGRYQEKHAYHHYYETSHLYALELETQRVWDYAGDGYVHRLIQNKTDGKLVELPSATVAATDRLEPNGRHYRSQGGGDSQPHHSGEDYEVDTIGQEKLDAIGLEYTYLLTSQLESQRMYFDAQMAAMASQLAQLSKETQQREKEMMLLTEQNRELTLHAETLEREKLPSLSKEKKTVEKKLEKAQDKLQILERQYEEEKELNIGLMNNQHNFRDQLKLKEEEILDLQEQVRDMMIYLDTQQRVEASPLKDEIVGGTIGVVATSSQQQPNQTGSGASGSSSTPSPSTNTHSRRKGRR
ncbi:hypothetical protein BGW38_004589 [Lunasporangiospora selenospora]|uniref:BRCA1-associated protein n=1 Tax=Lunasporangiospora selenospora TaxID=979761 RepID=A0A9P6KBF7_9FUNG|nr:hypothetical protein BGW38_004589 [Lunasporangiospora selenospora]